MLSICQNWPARIIHFANMEYPNFKNSFHASPSNFVQMAQNIFFLLGGGGGFQLWRSLQNSAFHLQINQDLACGVPLTSTYMTKWYEYKYSEKLNKYLYQIKIMRVMIKKIPVGAGPT